MRSVRNTAEGKVTTRSDTVMRVKRGNLNMVISMSSEFIETEAGEPVSMKSVQEMAGGKVVQEFVFKEDGVEQTVTQSGTVTTKTLPRPEGQWLPPPRRSGTSISAARARRKRSPSAAWTRPRALRS